MDRLGAQCLAPNATSHLVKLSLSDFVLKTSYPSAERDTEELQKLIDRRQDEVQGLREQLREVEKEKQAEIIKLTLEVHVKPHTHFLRHSFLDVYSWKL